MVTASSVVILSGNSGNRSMNFRELISTSMEIDYGSSSQWRRVKALGGRYIIYSGSKLSSMAPLFWTRLRGGSSTGKVAPLFSMSPLLVSFCLISVRAFFKQTDPDRKKKNRIHVAITKVIPFVC
jgi:hypothetical protein